MLIFNILSVAMSKEFDKEQPDMAEQERLNQLREEWECLTGIGRRPTTKSRPVMKSQTTEVEPSFQSTPGLVNSELPTPYGPPEDEIESVPSHPVDSLHPRKATQEEKVEFRSHIVEAIREILSNQQTSLPDILTNIGPHPETGQLPTPILLRQSIREAIDRMYHRTRKPLKRNPLSEEEKQVWEMLVEQSNYNRPFDIWREETSNLINWVANQLVESSPQIAASKSVTSELPGTIIEPNREVIISPPNQSTIPQTETTSPIKKKGERKPRLEQRNSTIKQEIKELYLASSDIWKPSDLFSQPQIPLLFSSSLTESFMGNLQEKNIIRPKKRAGKKAQYPRYSFEQIIQMTWIAAHRDENIPPSLLRKELPKIIRSVIDEVHTEQEKEGNNTA